MNKIFFLTDLSKQNKQNITKIFKKNVKIIFLKNINSFKDYKKFENSTLITFKTNIIVPEQYIKKFYGFAYNLHEAPPEYPGRDPHHFCIYNNEKNWGVTFHKLTKYVDSGEILYCDRFSIKGIKLPEEVLNVSYKKALNLLKKIKDKLISRTQIIPSEKITWKKKKYSRKMFEKLSIIRINYNKKKYDKIKNAVYHSKYNNLKIEICGDLFEIYKKIK